MLWFLLLLFLSFLLLFIIYKNRCSMCFPELAYIVDTVRWWVYMPFWYKRWWLYVILSRFLDVDCGSNSNNSSGEQGPEEDMVEPNNNSLFQENLEHRTLTETASIPLHDMWRMPCLGKSASCCHLSTTSGILSTLFVRIQIRWHKKC